MPRENIAARAAGSRFDGTQAHPVKIVVTIKLVPDTTADKRIDPETKRLVRTGPATVINPFDEYALEAALKLKDASGGAATVSVVTLGPESGKEIVRKALALGADDALIISDPAAAGSDVWGTAYALAQAIRTKGFDLVICGTNSTDASTGEVPGALADYLGVPALTYLRKLALEGTTVKAERETDNGFTRLRAPLPALASVTKGIGEPRYTNLKGIMNAKKKTIAIMTLAEAGVAKPIGQAAARTELTHLETPPSRGKGEVFEAADARAGALKIVEFLREKKLV